MTLATGAGVDGTGVSGAGVGGGTEAVRTTVGTAASEGELFGWLMVVVLVCGDRVDAGGVGGRGGGVVGRADGIGMDFRTFAGDAAAGGRYAFDITE